MESEARSRSSELRGKSRPAIGLHVPPNADQDEVAGAILRARRHGHEVFVVGVPGLTPKVRAVVDQLEATVVEPDRSRNGEPLRDVVAARVREAGYPGLLWQPDPAKRIDFDRSVAEINSASEYCLEARKQPAVTPEPHVLVAIPAYNEARTIAEVVADAREHADEVLVVDDGSEDDTVARAREAGAAVIEHETNQGYGASLKTAFREADRSRADHLVILDADGQHDPSDIPRLVRAQQEVGAELVTGSRFISDAETDVPLYRRFGLGIVNALTNVSMGIVRPSIRIRDTQCGFRVYGRELISSLASDPSIGSNMGASTDILHHAHAQGYEIEEIPTTVNYDVDDASTHTPVEHGVTLLMNLVQTVEQDRPISVLGIPGFALALLGVSFGYWTFSSYIQSGVFPLGLALTSTFFALTGVFACFTAIILHSLNTQLPDQ
jgi:hypothetical protein